jgi:uncharacterized membrane protein
MGKTGWKDYLLLLVWISVAAIVRFTNLDGKPPWTDEFATLVFSLGNSFQAVPLDQVISLETLMQPLRVAGHGPQTAITALINEDHHPPIYFALANFWTSWFSRPGELVDLWAARALPALLGVASIPAMYALIRLAVAQSAFAHIAAALLAVSPYGVFLAQEARHYTAMVLLVIASLGCLVIAARQLRAGQALSWGVAMVWVVVNTIGLGTHYFFILTLGAQTLLLGYLGWIWRGWRAWLGIGGAIAGTMAGAAAWAQLWLASRDDQMTEWLRSNPKSFGEWLLGLISPPFQILAAWVTMINLPPIESPWLPGAIAAGILLVFSMLGWILPLLYRAIRQAWQTQDTHFAVQLMGGFVAAAVLIFFLITYLLGMDITRGARYSFVYFPGVIALFALGLGKEWQRPAGLNWQWKGSFKHYLHGKNGVALVLVLALFGSFGVALNLGYQKYYRPDLLLPIIQAHSRYTPVIATTHNTLVQTGEIMGIGWQWRNAPPPMFLLAHQTQAECQGEHCLASETLAGAIAPISRPFDLWLINFRAPVKIDKCQLEDIEDSLVFGYDYRLYRCK